MGSLNERGDCFVYDEYIAYKRDVVSIAQDIGAQSGTDPISGLLV